MLNKKLERDAASRSRAFVVTPFARVSERHIVASAVFIEH
jgi:hypothetical protein